MKAMGTLAGLLKNKDRLQQAAANVKAKLAEQPAVGESGGGAVRAEIGPDLRVARLHIEPAVAQGFAADDASREMAQSLIRDAVNAGLDEAQRRLTEAITAEAEALGLGDLPFDPGNIGKLLS